MAKPFASASALAAGISANAAQRYEELARHADVHEAAEAYYAECKAAGRAIRPARSRL